MCDYFNAALVFVATIIGVAGGSAITWWGSVDLARRQMLNLVSARLVSAFKDELDWIKRSDITADKKLVYEILCAAFEKHHAAVTEFRFYLKKKSIPCFDKAWEKYHQHSANFSKDWPDYKKMNHLCEYLSVNDEEEQKARTLATQRIEKLLSYASIH